MKWKMIWMKCFLFLSLATTLYGQRSNLTAKDIIEDGRHWMVTYYEDGGIQMKVQHEHGIFDGKSLQYHENGALKAEGFYKKGQLTGSWKYYYASGVLKGSCTYQVYPWGIGQTGVSLTYHENGQIEEKKNYQNGKAAGTYERFNEEGKLTTVGKYLDGWKEGEWLEYDSDGQLLSRGSYIKDMQDGVWTLFSNGKWKSKTTYSKGVFVKTISNDEW